METVILVVTCQDVLGEGRWGQKTMQEVSSIKFSVYRALDLFGVFFFSVMILKNTGCYIHI